MLHYIKIKYSRLDIAGFTASLICAVHCLITPFLLTAGIIGSWSFMANPAFEITFILISIAIALISIIPSYRKHHHRLAPIIVMSIGLILVSSGKMLFVEGDWLEIVWTVFGACMIALGHFINWRIINKQHNHKTTSK